jgi:hypothetical protein
LHLRFACLARIPQEKRRQMHFQLLTRLHLKTGPVFTEPEALEIKQKQLQQQIQI